VAKPIKGTKQANLNLMGSIEDDNILGKDGNDTITGGAGNDKIDGGRGIDTAVYSGSFDDYAISFLGNRNGHGADDLRISVSDSVFDRDGSDTLKQVEWLTFNDATVNVATGDVASWDYFVNAEIDETAQKPATEDMIVGTGIPATGFGLARNEDAGIELGLKVHKRFDSPSTITTTDDYSDGELHFQVEDGVGGFFGTPPDPARPGAEWSFDFSIATGLNGAMTDLSDFTFKLLYDVDKSAGTDYRVLTLEAETTPQAAGQSGFQWKDEGTGLVFISDDKGNANVTQNSENYGFGFIRSFIDDDAGTPGIQAYTFGPGEFDIVLQAFEGSQLVASNHMVVDVI
jgi:hypothetical protein